MIEFISSIPPDLTPVPFILAIFAWLLFDTRKEAKTREDKLMGQIEKQNAQMDRIVDSLDSLEKQVRQLKGAK
ncbi:hypothetical protein A2U94_17850 [Bacillus sp. VT 712]|uniref:hypothetical protein n=1 Tax=Bacillaceae TaxID=186817 RepID=UPI0004732412|nr:MULTISPECIES: hypothetical protein [Bacillaceae]KZB90118.1 hypothetical protein A2U94_17850 [Bacillus sp. VT 712]